ncbi:rubrerythrin family protein [Ensifer sp. T173]|uniref:Rubrerythrin family protein n=1 Tax=Ensifer canadensis TaxID=555315 RepID=A0AAW4FDZ8_9HYPH|nr:ferritin family protein [Ensifer sp. ENS11]KQU90547.1 hypothetical protein ASD00_04040 [Ensifer sp. Root31]KQW67293.1 hypothetical protein ASD03_10475 [Ensifer sp. Root127]KQY63182.1 hypothetical protein ASD52_13340 [Ensifer sp. Root142]MBM3090375.1 rubrerythrin family protein [Ensifer canadensis]OMQ46559.1 hypothetical protein BKP54_01605 [Ensifer sp. 1H6]
MPTLRIDPPLVATLGELLELAVRLEREAIDGYVMLAKRMRRENRADLADLFEGLAADERGHLDMVSAWIEEANPPVGPARIFAATDNAGMFDDGDALIVAPELLNAYRAFSVAVRNEEQAFMLWSYVAADAASTEIRQAAERMALEELGHVRILRKARRTAFHDLRSHRLIVADDLAAVETQLADWLEMNAGDARAEGTASWSSLSTDARQRARQMIDVPFAAPLGLAPLPEGGTISAMVLCEFLLERYLDLSEREGDDGLRQRAQTFAAATIDCLQALRGRAKKNAATLATSPQ